VIANKMVSVI